MAQKGDPTLAKIRLLADQGKTMVGKAKFYRRKGLIYREFSNPVVDKGRTFIQLVVP